MLRQRRCWQATPQTKPKNSQSQGKARGKGKKDRKAATETEQQLVADDAQFGHGPAKLCGGPVAMLPVRLFMPLWWGAIFCGYKT